MDAGKTRHGYWLKSQYVSGVAFVLVAGTCSECRKESVRIDIDKTYAFCPYCGADMRKSKGAEYGQR